jgi:uncharacterized protein YbbC (DUF1343 family)
MIESEDYLDPVHKIPVYSLYGEQRRPTSEMLDHFDILLVDLQDLGCRIYTYLTTTAYMLEACAEKNKELWILDRPNPVGRPAEGMLLEKGWESFVGCGRLPMRHGLTLGEAAIWYCRERELNLSAKVIEMEGYQPEQEPYWGWPQDTLAWVNPSPNASSLNMARVYSGSVLLEGTTLSEGRGTTFPLEVIGAPDVDFYKVMKRMEKLAPQWLEGCQLRLCYFEPTFHKHAGRTCYGFQFHTDSPKYDHNTFRPHRLFALTLKTIRSLYPDYEIWRDFVYEYESERVAIDVINGGPRLREWIEDSESTPSDLEKILDREEGEWYESRRPSLLY